MMQPMDPLSQLAMCCGLGAGRRRTEFKGPKSMGYYYSPSTAHGLDCTGNSWTLAANPHYAAAAPQQQPYILLTQPVIIAGNPAPNQANTMTLVQHAQTAQPTNAFQTPLIIANHPSALLPQQPQQQQQSIVSSQYAIYSTSAASNANIMTAATPTKAQNNPALVYEQQQALAAQHGGVGVSGSSHHLDRSPQNIAYHRLMSKPPPMPTLMEANTSMQLTPPTEPPGRGAVTLSSEIFRQLEVIEKQVDLSRDMELVEVHGIVITRALDPYSLLPHLTEATLRRYNNHFLFNDNYVIRFIEVIKRPGQTLGLYIRTVQFEGPRGRGTRPGLVITKIDTDSPVYNSQVLHVGDEILSVNLVDIQGMSLDDVVIIMSIPKRLVLALRIHRDRDHLLSMNLKEQQQHRLFRNSIEQQQQRENSGMVSTAPYGYIHQQSRPAGGQVIVDSMGSMIGLSPSRRASAHAGLSTTIQGAGGIISHQNQSNLPYSEAQVDELRREMSRRAVMANHHQQDHHQHQQQQQQQQQQHRGDLTHLAQPARVQSAASFQINEAAALGRGDEGDVDVQVGNDDDYADEESDQQAQCNSGGGGGTAANWSTTTVAPDQQTTSSNFDQQHRSVAVTGGRNISATIRLADTPEQSSYFSSSIDAINRELKELRRQRMALSTNNEHAID